MITIRPEDVENQVSERWAAEAAALDTELQEIAESDAHEDKKTLRRDIFKANQRLWAGLKQILMEVSHRKCWYCESKNLRADNAVDHFRPKGGVLERRDHEGYWWLAFDWKNYRFCCTFCNSHRQRNGSRGGKAAHFPLVSEDSRAMGPEDPIRREHPELLDPCDFADPLSLWFEEDGSVRPRPNQDEIVRQRAEHSIKRYHLDDPFLNEPRNHVCNQVKKRLKRTAEDLDDIGDPRVLRRKLGEGIQDLKELIDPTAEYSMAARCMLMGLRGKYEVDGQDLAELVLL